MKDKFQPYFCFGLLNYQGVTHFIVNQKPIFGQRKGPTDARRAEIAWDRKDNGPGYCLGWLQSAWRRRNEGISK
jgi:hypothetical protein